MFELNVLAGQNNIILSQYNQSVVWVLVTMVHIHHKQVYVLLECYLFQAVIHKNQSYQHWPSLAAGVF